jgi:S1-C subfamily serine protease
MQDYSGYGHGGYGQPPPGDSGGPTAPLPPVPPQPPRRRVGLLSYVAVALAAGALGAGSVVALYHPAANSSASPAPSIGAPAPLPSSAVPSPGNGAQGAQGSLSKVAQGVMIINTTLQYSSERAAGTGMVINAASGLVLTNNHVIENATKISATVPATGQNFAAKVLGYDVTGDIALIRLQNASGLHQVPVGDSGQVKVGDAVTALGNAQGQNRIVPAPGRITGVNRTITASDQGGTVRSETLHGMLQTDAGIVSGDSGGPLVSAAGHVIGMDTAGNDVSMPDQQQTASGFAIPINTALSVARDIVAGHASSTISIGYPPFIGIYVGSGTSSDPQQQAAAQQNNGFGGFGGFGGNGSGNGSGNGQGNGQSCYNNESNLPVPSTIAPVSSGTLIVGVICGSPAAAAGVTAGSVITSLNGQAIGAPQTVHNALAKFHPGDSVSLTWVTPSGQHKTANVTLTAGPPL